MVQSISVSIKLYCMSGVWDRSVPERTMGSSGGVPQESRPRERQSTWEVIHTSPACVAKKSDSYTVLSAEPQSSLGFSYWYHRRE